MLNQIRTVLIDTETDSSNPEKANLKFFGGLDCDTGAITMLDYTNKDEILDYLKKYNVWIGFNLKGFDKKVLERFGVDYELDDYKYKVVIDLYEILAPKGDYGYGKNNKNRLSDINPALKFKDYKLKTIIEVLGLDDSGKGEIDYDIFKKDEWDDGELKEIYKYLKQDLLIEKKLFDWYKNIFKPLESYLSKDIVSKCKHLNCSSGSLAYRYICSQTGIKEEYNSTEQSRLIKSETPKLEGGHHIFPRWEKVKGNIVCRDFVSHYPTIIIMAQLHSKEVNDAVEKNLGERLKAKANGDKETALALKVPLNSIYGLCGNPTFKNIYNHKAASECTRIGRELLKRYAQTLEMSGMIPVYGFTDSVYCGIPKPLTEEDLDLVTDNFIQETKKEFVKPIDSYNLGFEKRLKFMWFIGKACNNYLWVDDKDKVGIKGGMFDKNCPACIKKIFDDYITPKIVKTLNVLFTEDELFEELAKILYETPELASQVHSVKQIGDYNVETSLQYQISKKYGPGKHLLIPNTSGIGVGRGKDLKYCTVEEFKKNNLTIRDIATERMMRYLLPFYSTKEEVLIL